MVAVAADRVDQVDLGAQLQRVIFPVGARDELAHLDDVQSVKGVIHDIRSSTAASPGPADAHGLQAVPGVMTLHVPGQRGPDAAPAAPTG
jgi:hypothetical protein